MTDETVIWRRGRNTPDAAEVWLGEIDGRWFAITRHRVGGVKIWRADAEGRLGELVALDMRDLAAAQRACLRRMGRSV